MMQVMSFAEKTNQRKIDKVLFNGKRPIVIIGTGPVGIRMLEELHTASLYHPIIIYGGEPWMPYNRVRLSSLLAGEVSHEDILLSNDELVSDPIVRRYNCKIVSIDRENKVVIDELGNEQEYEKLILATGSEPFIPNIPGIELEGVFKFRDLNDTEKLIARRTRSRKTVIIGGGLLGLEAARAMQRFSTSVTVIEHNNRLLFRQLDETGSNLFKKIVEDLDIEVLVSNQVKKINGERFVESIELRNGKTIECDTLIVSAGIKPNTELAKEAGLAFGRGVKVNDAMQTSDSDIYAIGECCEHQGEVYGIVAPGFEQALIAAQNIASIKTEYKGTLLATSLKVVGHPVFSMGEVDESVKTYSSYTYQDKDTYRRINVYRGQIIGIIALGEWTEIIKLREYVKKGKLFFPWQLYKFSKTGNIWGEDSLDAVNSWPAETIICSCNGITRGQLSKNIESGCASVKALADKTGASTVCGSCKPLLASMFDDAELEPVRAYKPLYYGSVIFIAMALIAWLFPAIPYNNSVQVSWRWDVLWTSTLFKQISGFTLLGISVIVLILSLRKRIKWMQWGDFSLWRLFHALLGGAAIFVLLIHTGFRLGDNMNFILMMCFSGLILLGAILGSVIAMEHKLDAALVKQIRSLGTWLHILLFWPIPVLLGFHIFKTYYF
jgi:nitrite reductase (NADH) large subunit